MTGLTDAQQALLDEWTEGLELFRFDGPVKQYAGLRSPAGEWVQGCAPATVDALERKGAVERVNSDPWLAIYRKP